MGLGTLTENLIRVVVGSVLYVALVAVIFVLTEPLLTATLRAPSALYLAMLVGVLTHLVGARAYRYVVANDE